MPAIEIRDAIAEDSVLILKFIKELATYEKAEQQVIATVPAIKKSLFGKNSTARCLICTVHGEAVGFAVYFFNYSTWLGKYGLYLEDLYISQGCRGTGAGKALLKYLAKIALSNNCGRFEWNVLDWNEPAIKFYQSIGAEPQGEWVRYRLEGASLKNFACS